MMYICFPTKGRYEGVSIDDHGVVVIKLRSANPRLCGRFSPTLAANNAADVSLA